MTWVNLDDVYVSTSGGTINGNLAVNGSLTCKNGSTTYNVGSQLATLGDSVSHTVSSNNSSVIVDKCIQVGKAVFIKGHLLKNTTGWINATLTGNPKPIADVGISFFRPADKSVWPEGMLAYDNKVWILSNTSSGYELGWSAMYITAQYSVSHALQNVDKIFVGSKVSSTCDNSEIQVFADDEFKQLFGRSFDISKDFVGVMNGDWTAVPTYLNSAIYSNSSKIIWTQAANGNTYKQIRINYIVVLCK